jgi:hypothetical protein
VAEFVRYQLEDGSEVYFEAAESDLVSLRGGEAEVTDAGPLADRLQHVAKAAEQVTQSLRSRLTPDEIKLEFGIKVSGEVNWWFFAKNKAEGTISVSLVWKPQSPAESKSAAGS